MNSNINSNKKSAKECAQNVSEESHESKQTKGDAKTTHATPPRRPTAAAADDEMKRVYIRAPPNRHVHDVRPLNR